MLSKSAFFLFLAIACLVSPVATEHSGAAFAQDQPGTDTGDNDRGANDDDDSRGEDWWASFDRPRRGGTQPTGPVPGFGFEPIQTPPPVVTAPRPPAPTPPPQIVLETEADGEILVANLSPADLAALQLRGFAVISALDIPVFNIVLTRLTAPGDVTLEEALALVQDLPSGALSDFNHYYRTVQAEAAVCEGEQCAERQLVGWPVLPSREVACGRGVEIGMIDSGINEDHVTFAGALLELHRMEQDEGLASGGKVHGTSVAALLVGDPASRSPGLIPGANLVAVDAFHRVGGDIRTDVVSLIQGLALLAERQVKIINLSLAGPDNALLANVVGQLTMDLDVVVVAAVGNDGPDAGPAYPAAYGPVLAVTGVDRQGGIYEQAVQGDHVDLSAPGVEVWTAASVKGARWKTGTSFAAPFVSAAAAILRQSQPDMSMDEVVAVLVGQAKDLGDPGQDPVFGAGLLNFGALCDGQI